MDRLAERAYGRPLRAEETATLRNLYQELRQQGQGVEESLRGAFRAVLMSPYFFFHIAAAPAGKGIYPLNDDALASRLSHFLWSSLPDEELIKAARAGTLHDEQVLRAQVRRMLKDPRTEAFVREFFDSNGDGEGDLNGMIDKLEYLIALAREKNFGRAAEQCGVLVVPKCMPTTVVAVAEPPRSVFSSIVPRVVEVAAAVPGGLVCLAWGDLHHRAGLRRGAGADPALLPLPAQRGGAGGAAVVGDIAA